MRGGSAVACDVRGSSAGRTRGSVAAGVLTDRETATASKQGQGNNNRPVASDSWAEEVVSDAELVCITDESVDVSAPQQQAANINTGQSRGNAAVPGERRADTGQSNVGNTGNHASGSGNAAPRGKNGMYNSNGGNAGTGARSGGASVNESGGQYRKPAKIVTRNGWRPASEFNNDSNNRKRKQSGNAGDRENKRVLTGGRNAPNRDVFVLNLNYSECRSHEDLAELVKDHCRSKGVGVVFTKVFTYEYDLTFANCRVTVKDFDEQKVLEEGFWPLRASAREWMSNIEYRKQRMERAAEEGNGDQPQNLHA